MSDHVLAAYVVSAIAVIGIIVLAVTRNPIPEVLAAVALVSVGGGAGATHPDITGARARRLRSPEPGQ